MEFKKSNRYSTRQSKPAVSTNTDTAPLGSRTTRRINSARTTRRVDVSPLPLTQNLAHSHRLSSKKVGITIGLLVVLVLGISIVSIYTAQQKPTKAPSNVESVNKIAKKLENQAVLPGDKSITAVNGHLLRPPNSDPVFVFTDTISTIPINVTQQTLPETFISNNKVTELAQKFNATTELKAGSTSFYLGTSSKGPQSVILTKNDLLILIKSQKRIADKDWVSYIETLK